MDANNQPIHERRISKLSGRARKLKQLERDKDNCVATIGPNHPVLAASRMRGPTTKNAMSAPLGVRTSPHRTHDASAINLLALFTQQARAAGTTVPIDSVILNLDGALVNASKAKPSSDNFVSSETSSNKAGDDNPNKGITLTGEEQPFVPLPDNYLKHILPLVPNHREMTTMSSTNPLICVMKRLVSLLFLKDWHIISMGTKFPIAIERL
jgi:hypothetical protein